MGGSRRHCYPTGALEALRGRVQACLEQPKPNGPRTSAELDELAELSDGYTSKFLRGVEHYAPRGKTLRALAQGLRLTQDEYHELCALADVDPLPYETVTDANPTLTGAVVLFAVEPGCGEALKEKIGEVALQYPEAFEGWVGEVFGEYDLALWLTPAAGGNRKPAHKLIDKLHSDSETLPLFDHSETHYIRDDREDFVFLEKEEDRRRKFPLNEHAIVFVRGLAAFSRSEIVKYVAASNNSTHQSVFIEAAMVMGRYDVAVHVLHGGTVSRRERDWLRRSVDRIGTMQDPRDESEDTMKRKQRVLRTTTVVGVPGTWATLSALELKIARLRQKAAEEDESRVARNLR